LSATVSVTDFTPLLYGPTGNTVIVTGSLSDRGAVIDGAGRHVRHAAGIGIGHDIPATGDGRLVGREAQTCVAVLVKDWPATVPMARIVSVPGVALPV